MATAPIHGHAPLHPPPEGRSAAETALRLAYLLLLLYGFLVAIEAMSKAIRVLTDAGMLGGGGDDAQLFGGVSNPFAGLALGVLFTVLVQSSSTTTSAIVAVVGSGTLSVEDAVPMILGANIGTTITNTLVSVGHVRRSREFYRAFSAATVHDFFNLMMVAIFLPLEIATGFLARSAGVLSGLFSGGGGGTYKSPIKVALREGHAFLREAVAALGLSDGALGWAMLALGIVLTFVCLLQITKNMRRLMAGRIEQAMNRTLEGSAVIGVAIGLLLTVAVQSSSVTTSLLVPMCAAGVMRLRHAFPIMLGANVGTTVTAMLASLAQDRPEALTIAFVHLLFNAIGVALCLSIPPLGAIPLWAATSLGRLAMRSRVWVLVYVLGVFLVIPLLGWTIYRGVAA